MTLKEHLRAERVRYLQRALDDADGNIAQAARVAGIGRTSFYRTLQIAKLRRNVGRARGGNAAWQSLQG